MAGALGVVAFGVVLVCLMARAGRKDEVPDRGRPADGARSSSSSRSRAA